MGRESIMINVSEKKHSEWTDDKLRSAYKMADYIIDVSLYAVDAEASEDEIVKSAEDIYLKVLDCISRPKEEYVVNVDACGYFHTGLVFVLMCMLLNGGLKVVYPVYKTGYNIYYNGSSKVWHGFKELRLGTGHKVKIQRPFESKII